MDISNLDCPQYVKFPIEDFELSFSIEGSTNTEKHVEDSCADLSIPDDEEESYIFVEDSSHTENSISENEEYSSNKLEISSEKVEDGKAQNDVSDQFVSAIGSAFDEDSCTEEDIIVPVKFEDHSEHIKDNSIQSDVLEDQDCTVDSVFRSITGVGSGHESKPINSESTLKSVSGQSDCSIYLDTETGPKTESAPPVSIESEDHSEDVKDNSIQRDAFDHVDCIVDSVSTTISCAGSEDHSELVNGNLQSDVLDHLDCMVDSVSKTISCAGFEAHSEHVKDENMQSDVSEQCDSMVDTVSEAISCQGFEDHLELVKDNLQSDVLDRLDCMVDSVSKTIPCAEFETDLEHVRDEKVKNEEQCDSMVDIVSGAISCQGSAANSESINNEATLNYVFGQSNCMVDLDAKESSNQENSVSAEIECEVLAECFEDENLQSNVFDFNGTIDLASEAISCLGSAANSEPINNEGSSLSGALDQSDSGIDLDSETSSSTVNALVAQVGAEVYSENMRDERIQSVPDQCNSIVDSLSEVNSGAEEDISVCKKHETNSEFVINEEMQNVVSDSVDLYPKESCVEDAVVAPSESEVHAGHVQHEIMDSKVCSHLDDLVSTTNSCSGEDTLICAKSEVHSEHVKENLQIDVFDHLDCMVDSVATAVSCAGAEVYSENMRDERIQSVPDQCNSIVDSLSEVNSGAEEDISVCKKHEKNSEFVINEEMQNVVSNSVDLYPKKSCVEDAVVAPSESKNNSDFKDTNDEIVQRQELDMDGLCMGIDSEKVEAMAVIEADLKYENNSDFKDINDEIVHREDMVELCAAIDSKKVETKAVIEADLNLTDLESMKKNKSDAQMNQACNITKVSSESKGAISKNKQDVYVPLAQQVAAFQQKCPERYLSSRAKNFQSTKNWAPPKYVPKSPNLQAAKRHRDIKTNVEDVKRYEFHARPFNPKIFEKPVTLETEKQSKQPKSFTLKTAMRAEAHAKNENLDAKKTEFHARPVPKSCHVKLNEPEKVKTHTTKPKSPNFALKNREEKWSQRSTKTNDDSKPPNHKMCPKQPKPTDLSQSVLKHEKKPIEVLPFSFEEREKARMAMKQQKSQDFGKENQKPGFKAREMPSFKPPALPSIQRKPATQPEPFTFLSESRISSQKGDTTISDKTGFKTHSVLKTFNPKKVLSLAEAKEFQLHTEKRAKEWKQIEEVKKAEEMERQRALEAYKAAQEREEQREVMKMRQDAVHKANPIRAYKNVEIKPSNLVTQPFTPKFETDKRLQSRLEKTEIQF